MQKLILPARSHIHKTTPKHEDPVELCYSSLLGGVFRKRLSNTLALLSTGHEKILDIGYGSGVLFPSLLQFTQQCFGLESHGQEEKIYEFLAKEKIDLKKVLLTPGSILDIPFSDASFPAIVSVSTLEHIQVADLDKAMSEMFRIVKTGGEIALSFPVRNVITDGFFTLIGYDQRSVHPSSHRDIIGAAKKYFTIEKIITMPSWLGLDFSIYCSIKCLKTQRAV
jgi:ubiquinone/menaquinone biosynthesis C-methylase UbiE